MRGDDFSPWLSGNSIEFSNTRTLHNQILDIRGGVAIVPLSTLISAIEFDGEQRRGSTI
jgi:hypothetical protein